jgi:hypothetical protein
MTSIKTAKLGTVTTSVMQRFILIAVFFGEKNDPAD